MECPEIIGQDHAVGRLKGYLTTGNIDGTYLFTGPEGIGKFAVARLFARAIACTDQAVRGCGQCPGCIKAARRAHPDIHEIDCGDGEIKIEDVRILQDRIFLRPYESAKKVFLVNNAHNVNIVSANAFLKTLEEPPKDSVIVLVTDKPSILPSTIVSRCRTVKFAALPREQLERFLADRFSFTSDEASAYALLAEGRVGAALRLRETGGLAQRNAVIDGLWSDDIDAQKLLGEERGQVRVSLNILAAFFRDVYVFKSGAGQGSLIHKDKVGLIEQACARYSFAALDEVMATISGAFVWLEQNVNVKLLVSNVVAAVRV